MRGDPKRLEREVKRILPKLKRLGAKKIILFGSLAVGKVRVGSDIDLFVLFDDKRNFKRRIRWIYSVLDFKEDVNLLPYNYEEFDRLKDRPFFHHLLRTGKILYETPR